LSAYVLGRGAREGGGGGGRALRGGGDTPRPPNGCARARRDSLSALATASLCFCAMIWDRSLSMRRAFAAAEAERCSICWMANSRPMDALLSGFTETEGAAAARREGAAGGGGGGGAGTGASCSGGGGM
jgi:hypothetical protein